MEIPDKERQIIIYGAPGTGKSHYFENKLEKEKEKIPKENQFRTTFHPDSDYSTFVGAYKPTMVGNTIQYKFIPQVFLKAYVRAYEKKDQNVYLIIEEINRGNCAQIFGDIFQLLDRKEDGSSEYDIDADEDIKAYLEETLGKDAEGIKDGKLRLPSNLYIYATMNTSDQSLFPIDSAFKRRWYWAYSPIEYSKTNWGIKIGENYTYSWTSFQHKVNDKILAATNSEDKMLGDYFVKASANNIISKEMFRDKVLFCLWNDVCKDGSGDIFVDDKGENKKITFSDLFKKDGDNKLIAIMEHLKVDKKNIEESEEEKKNIEDENKTSNPKKKNYDQYSINGEGAYSKSRILIELIKKFNEFNPNISAKDFEYKWNFVNKIVASAIMTNEDNKRNYSTETINIGGKDFYINTQIWNKERTDALKDKLKEKELGLYIEAIQN